MVTPYSGNKVEKIPGIISLVNMRCPCTTLFLDLNLVEGRHFGTGSKPKGYSFSSTTL
jgi:hypothetical protein